MSDLYQLEHKIIPNLLFPDKEGRKVNPFRLGNNFSEICLDILRRMHGNMGTIGLDEEGDVRLLMEKCNEDFGIV